MQLTFRIRSDKIVHITTIPVKALWKHVADKELTVVYKLSQIPQILLSKRKDKLNTILSINV